MNKQNILILAAHPDDETLGCGATINLLSEKSNIHLITFTDGVSSRGSNEPKRFDILDYVCAQLGIASYKVLNYPDNMMDTMPLLGICKTIEENTPFDPDIIFTHWVNDLNIDHQVVAKATTTVFRPQLGLKHTILSYFVPSASDYNPFHTFDGTYYVDVSKTYLYKLGCLETFYKDELRIHPHTRSIENIENLMKVWGSEVGCAYCEKFKFVRGVI